MDDGIGGDDAVDGTDCGAVACRDDDVDGGVDSGGGDSGGDDEDEDGGGVGGDDGVDGFWCSSPWVRRTQSSL